MGCDIYTWHDLVIIYEDASGVLVKRVFKEDKAEKHYGYEKSTGRGSYDPDFEDPPRDALQQMQDSYGVKSLYSFQQNYWFCKEFGKIRMLRLLAGEGIPSDSVKEIYKVLNGYWRDYEDCNWEKIHKQGWTGAIRLKDMTGELGGEDEGEEDESEEEESVGSE